MLLTCEQPGSARREATALTDPWAGEHVLCGLGQLSSGDHQGDGFNSESSLADSNDFSTHPDHKLAISVSTILSPAET